MELCFRKTFQQFSQGFGNCNVLQAQTNGIFRVTRNNEVSMYLIADRNIWIIWKTEPLIIINCKRVLNIRDEEFNIKTANSNGCRAWLSNICQNKSRDASGVQTTSLYYSEKFVMKGGQWNGKTSVGGVYLYWSVAWKVVVSKHFWI